MASREKGRRRGHDAQAAIARGDGVGDYPAYGRHRPIKGELPHEEVVTSDGGVHLSCRDKDRDGQGQVETRTRLSHLPGREVDGDVQPWNGEAACPDRAPHP